MRPSFVYRAPVQYSSPQLYRRPPYESYSLSWLYNRSTQSAQVLTEPGGGWDSNSIPYGQSPPVVTGDVLIVPLLTLPNLHAVIPQADGGLDIDLQGDPSRQILTACDIYDASLASFFGASDQSVNGLPPITPEPTDNIEFTVGVPITPIDFTDFAISPYGDTLTVTAVDVAPPGMEYDGPILVGTPTTIGEYVGQTLRATDPYGLSSDWDIGITVAEVVFVEPTWAFGWPRGRPSRHLPRYRRY